MVRIRSIDSPTGTVRPRRPRPASGSWHGVAVAFATDDSVPARDLDTGESLPPVVPEAADGSAEEPAGGPVRRALVGVHPVGAPAQRGRRRRPLDPGELAGRFAPLTLAGQRRLTLSEAMAPVAPEGLQRGTTVGVAGSGARSVALALTAGPMATGSWLAVVGGAGLCLVGAEQLGVVLHRTVLVDEPPQASWGSVVAALLDAFDLVVLDGRQPIGVRDARRLSGRARERGAVLVDVAGSWPDPPDLSVDVVGRRWRGIGAGHGLLLERTVELAVSGRRGAAAGHRVALTLPPAVTSPLLRAALAAEEPPVEDSGDPASHAGADVDALVAAVAIDTVAAADGARDRAGTGDPRTGPAPLRAAG